MYYIAMNESIKDIIAKTVRKFRGKRTITEVHLETRISEAYLRRIEKGLTNATTEILEKLANYFGVHIVQLFGYEAKPRPIIEVNADDHFGSIPLLSDPASLGSGLVIDEAEVMEEPCLIHKRILKKGHTYRAIFVKGDSMIPILEDGDMVAIDLTERDPKRLNKKLIACHTGDFEVTVKRLFIAKDKFYFRAFNRKWEEEHAPLITAQKDGLILGKVVWAWKEFR